MDIWGISEIYVFMVTGLVLIAIGFYGLITRRNIIKILISVELLYSAAVLETIVFFHYLYPAVLDALVFALVLIAAAAVDAGFGIVLAIRLMKIYGAPNIDVARKLRGE